MKLATAQQQRAGPIRRETLFGREHIVVPTVAVQEQVLENNIGRMLLPAEEIERSASAWNFTPVTLGHPQRGGRPTTARDPDVVNSRVIGILFNAEFKDGALKADVFIDPEQAENVRGGEELIAQLERGEIGEVSTGFSFSADNESGEFEGDEFDLIARNIQPDHFAVGIEEGACSVEDGCGLGINVRSEARTPTFSGTTEGEWSAPSLSDFTDQSWDELSEGEKQEIVETTLLGEVEDTFSESFVFPVVEPNGALNRNALNAVRSVARGGRGGADVPEAAAESAFRKAGQLLEEEFDVDSEDAQSMADSIWERLKAHFRKEQTMDDDRIDALSEATGLDREHIEGLEDEARETLAANVLEPEDGDEPEDEPADNADDGAEPEVPEAVNAKIESLEEQVERLSAEREKEKEGLVRRLADNERCPFDEDTLSEKPLEELEGLAQMAKVRRYDGRGGPRVDTGDEVELGFEVEDLWADDE